MAETGATSQGATDAQLAEEIEISLRENLRAAWFPRVIDRNGGYIEHFDHRWRATGDRSRTLVHQARLAWTAAALAEQDDSRRDALASHAVHGIKFIDTVLRDEKHGGFYWDADTAGRPLRNGEKHAYALAFAIFAGAKVALVTGDTRALAVARDASSWLEEHCRQSDGLYIENARRDGSALMKSEARSRRRVFGLVRVRPSRDPIGSAYGRHTVNTHLHLLEAYSELNRADPRGPAESALENVLEIVRDRFAANDGTLPLELGREGQPVGKASFGHTAECAAILVDAAESLGSPKDSRTHVVARRLAEKVLREGRDARHGGTFEAPERDGGRKMWWVLAEALNTWSTMFALERPVTGGAPPWRGAMAGEWAFIRDHFLDRENGGWLKETRRDGSASGRHPKSDAWTDPYHNARALLNAVKVLRQAGHQGLEFP